MQALKRCLRSRPSRQIIPLISKNFNLHRLHFYVVLIGGLFSIGLASVVWPQTLRRLHFGIIRLALPLKAQIVITRIIGIFQIVFSIAILVA